MIFNKQIHNKIGYQDDRQINWLFRRGQQNDAVKASRGAGSEDEKEEGMIGVARKYGRR